MQLDPLLDNTPKEATIIPQSESLADKVSAESRAMFRLGTPILAVQLLQVSVMVADTVMAGRYSATDLSGVAIGGSIFFPLFLFLLGLLSALTPTVAQLHGGKRYGDIAGSVFQCAWLVCLLAPLAMLLVFFVGPLLNAIGADDETRSITHDYLIAMAIGLPGVLLFNVLRFYSDGVSLTKPAVIASLLGVLINIPLNYLFIYGSFGFPELGGAGCGWASAISFYVSFLYMLAYIACSRAYRNFPLFAFGQSIRIHLSEMKHLVQIGLPIGFAHLIESSMFAVIALFLASLGPVIVASHQIALNVATLVFMIPLSLSIALTIRVGFLVGAKEYQEARFCSFFGIGVGVFYAIVSAGILLVFRQHIVSIYNASPQVIALASALIAYAAIFQLGDAVQVTAAGALRGYKDTRSAMLIMMLTFWCFGLPLGYVLGLTDILIPAMEAEGFWLGLVLGLMAAGTLLALRLHRVSAHALKAELVSSA